MSRVKLLHIRYEVWQRNQNYSGEIVVTSNQSGVNMTVNRKVLVCIVALAAILRFWGAFENIQYTGDEYVQVPSAISMFTYGTMEELQWVHPPMSSIILKCTMSLFGNNPVGWRIGNIFFGTATVFLIFLIATQLYHGSVVPILAASLVALDPLHINYSRTTFMEVPTTCFFLIFLYFMLEFSEKRKKTLLYAGVALGVTIATKAYYLFTIPIVILYALFRAYERKELNVALIVDFTVALLILPLCIYFLTFIYWFGRGYTLSDFINLKSDAVWTLKNITIEYFHAKEEILAGGKPWQWFLKPTLFGYRTFADGDNARYLLEINNFPFRMLVLPAMFVATVYAWQKRLWHELLLPVLFVVCYALYLIVSRPVFSSNSIVLLPFAYLVVSKCLVSFARWLGMEKQVYGIFLTVIFVWGLYTFPLVTGRLVPVSLYKPILSVTHVMTPNSKGH